MNDKYKKIQQPNTSIKPFLSEYWEVTDEDKEVIKKRKTLLDWAIDPTIEESKKTNLHNMTS